MQAGIVPVLLLTLGASYLVGCTPPEPAAAARHSEAKDVSQAERDQRALEGRRLKLQKQVLSELRKLRESRQASTSGAEAVHEEEPASPADSEWLLFGGASHDVFLGCLCDESRPDSIFNRTGEHGSDDSPVGIRNKFAPYGSNYEDTSACNAAATHPPLVLASDGKSLGLLTTNPSLKRRITTPAVTDWLARMCGV